GSDHGELHLAERRGNLPQHLKEVRRRLALRRPEIYRDRYLPDSRPPRGLQPHVQRGRTAHLAEKIARRARVAADLLGQDAQQEQLDFGRTYPPGQLEPAHQVPNVLRVESARLPLQRDYVVKEMRLAASRGSANPEHRPLRLCEMLIEDFPRAFGRAREHVARDGRDARRRLQSQSFACRRLEFEPAPRARAPLPAVVQFHPLRQHCHCARSPRPALLQLHRIRLDETIRVVSIIMSRYANQKVDFWSLREPAGTRPCSFVSFRAESAEPRDPGSGSLLLERCDREASRLAQSVCRNATRSAVSLAVKPIAKRWS